MLGFFLNKWVFIFSGNLQGSKDYLISNINQFPSCLLPLFPFLPRQPGESMQKKAWGLVISTDVHVSQSRLELPPRCTLARPLSVGPPRGGSRPCQHVTDGLCECCATACDWGVMTVLGQQKEKILWVLVHLVHFLVALEICNHLRIPLQTTKKLKVN